MNTKLFKIFCGVLLALSCGAGFAAQPPVQPIELNIPAQSLRDALAALGQQTGLQVIYTATEVTDALSAPSVVGSFTAQDALTRLLGNSGFRFEYLDDRTVAILARSPKSSAVSQAADFRLAQMQAVSNAEGPQTSSSAASASQSLPSNTAAADEVVVTGSHIRGIADQFSPVTRYGREDMDRAGFSNVKDLMASLPQNFGGGITADTRRGSTAGPGAESVNLRGLGVEGSLTLLNGRRLAPGGVQGEFVDIAALPTSAIERVEVLTDGASAIYGSDAIAGVVNVILRKDYSGAESRLRLGTMTEGDGDEIQLAQALGHVWSGGRALLSYEYAEVDPLATNDKSFGSNALDGDMLLPASHRHSVFASGGLNLGERWELSADGYLYDRSTELELVQLSGTTIARNEQTTDVKQYGGAVGLGVDLSGGWRVDSTLSMARSDYSSPLTNLLTNGVNMHEGVTEVATAEATLGGPIFQLGNTTARALVGAQARQEDFSGLLITFPSGVAQINSANDREVTAVFGELYFPFITESNQRAGVRRLAVSLAGRYEDYSDVGTTTNPKVGLLWSPVSGLTLRGTYGTSFRAPRLQQLVDQLSNARLINYIDPQSPTGISIAIQPVGSTSNLDPETSTTWTIGFDLEPTFAPGLRVRASYFDIVYDDRIANAFPTRDVPTRRYFDHPLPVVRNVSAAEVDRIVAAAPILVNETGPVSFFSDASDPVIDQVTILVDSRATNTTATRVDGIDLAVSYGLDSDIGHWSGSLDASYLLNFEEQFSASRPVITRVDTVTFPVDLKLRGGLTLTSGALSTSAFLNYVDGYDDNQRLGDPVPVASWTTVDATVRYDFGVNRTTGALAGMAVSFTARNLFNRDPPPVGTEGLVGATRSLRYDTANADPQGRVVSLQFTKAW